MRILIAIHDPATADQTLLCAAQFARCDDDSCVVLAIIENPKRPWPADDLLERAREIFHLPNLTLNQHTGDPLRHILVELKRSSYDLLVIGESQTPLAGHPHLLRDRIAHKLAEQSPCPLLVVRPPVRPLKRILMCDSGAENSVLRRFVLQVADMLEGEEEITVLHVMSQISAGPGVPGRQLRADVQELIAENAPEGRLLAQNLRLLSRQGIHPIAKVRHGLVVDEILSEASSGDYDLVVIGANRQQGWTRFLLDDLAHKILAHMDRPVLVVR
jgi:nucleotide-binding universal stress UspA family protein